MVDILIGNNVFFHTSAETRYVLSSACDEVTASLQHDVIMICRYRIGCITVVTCSLGCNKFCMFTLDLYYWCGRIIPSGWVRWQLHSSCYVWRDRQTGQGAYSDNRKMRHYATFTLLRQKHKRLRTAMSAACNGEVEFSGWCMAMLNAGLKMDLVGVT